MHVFQAAYPNIQAEVLLFPASQIKTEHFHPPQRVARALVAININFRRHRSSRQGRARRSSPRSLSGTSRSRTHDSHGLQWSHAMLLVCHPFKRVCWCGLLYPPTFASPFPDPERLAHPGAGALSEWEQPDMTQNVDRQIDSP